MDNKHISIAIDGPAGAGKSTIAKVIAQNLNFVYIDTGAMYRAVGLYALRRGADCKNADAVCALLGENSIDIRHKDASQLVFLCGEDVTGEIRTPAVSVAASDVAVIPAVRLKLVDLQREIAKNQNCIMDGRDIGTYVLPEADIKIFLTADVTDRARRRFDELVQKGQTVTFDEVLSDMRYRDANDAGRAFAPLKPADDAKIIDTTGNELADSIQILTDYIKNKLEK